MSRVVSVAMPAPIDSRAEPIDRKTAPSGAKRDKPVSPMLSDDCPTPVSEMDQIVGIKIVDLFCTQLLKSAVGVPTTHKISRGPSSWVGRAARRGGEYLRAGTTHSGAGAGAGRDAHPPVISLTTDSAERPLDVGRLLH